jgi:hypothetical protein
VKWCVKMEEGQFAPRGRPIERYGSNRQCHLVADSIRPTRGPKNHPFGSRSVLFAAMGAEMEDPSVTPYMTEESWIMGTAYYTWIVPLISTFQRPSNPAGDTIYIYVDTELSGECLAAAGGDEAHLVFHPVFEDHNRVSVSRSMQMHARGLRQTLRAASIAMTSTRGPTHGRRFPVISLTSSLRIVVRSIISSAKLGDEFPA